MSLSFTSGGVVDPSSDDRAMISSQIASQISSQLPESTAKADRSDADDTSNPHRTPSKSPSKSRSFSESLPQLSPSPKFREPKKESKDDHTIISSPRTPRRPELLSRGLSLQMPPREPGMLSSNVISRAPLSPQLDRTHTYASPLHLLPRRSRGAEFSRACTNLHHSTLAEQSSPDSSPTITQKAMMIPPRKPRTSSFIMDSPGGTGSIAWTSNNLEKTITSSSVGSVNMLGTDDSSSSSSEMEDNLGYQDDTDDPMLMTPQVTKSNYNIPSPFGLSSAANGQSPGGWSNSFAPGAPNFMSIQRARLRKARSRKSSSSGKSSIASPGPASPPHSRNMEASGGYFAREAVMRKSNSRRESLSLHTNDLHISSGNDSGDEGRPQLPSTPGVVRRVVTRRGNLLVCIHSRLPVMEILTSVSQNRGNSVESKTSYSKRPRQSIVRLGEKQRLYGKCAKATMTMTNPHFLRLLFQVRE